ncbi:MAG TPA: hypothetical protein QF753_13545 [Victivallales bacterium]|nr:hypothetical protein [Victivallales bacterium]
MCNKSNEKEKKSTPKEDVYSICGEDLFKLPDDDDVDADDVYDSPIVPGTSGVEC